MISVNYSLKGAQSAPLGLTDLPKPGWAIARPAHPSRTSLLHI